MACLLAYIRNSGRIIIAVLENGFKNDGLEVWNRSINILSIFLLHHSEENYSPPSPSFDKIIFKKYSIWMAIHYITYFWYNLNFSWFKKTPRVFCKMQKFRVTGSKWLWFSIHVIKVPANFIHFSQEMQLFLKKERWKLGLILMCWSRIVETASKRNSFMEEHFIISFVKSPPKTHRFKVHNKCNCCFNILLHEEI